MGSDRKSQKSKLSKDIKMAENQKSRRVKVAKYKSFQLQKSIKIKDNKLPSSWRLLRRTGGIFRRNWKLFLGIIAIYIVLTLVLVQGFSATSVDGSGVKSSFTNLLHGDFKELGNSASIFVYLLGSTSGGVSAAAGVYQVFIGLIISLAVIWALRQIYAGSKIRIRDSFYKGMQPLVPFVLVVLVIGIQLLPLAGGALIYTTVVNQSIAATLVEQLIWAAFFFALCLLSLYMLCSSLFALYIVCLPDVTPVVALRAARELVLHRRWEILRKVIFLPIALLSMAAIIIVPLILVAAPVASVVFFLLSMMVLPVVHTYLYALYREML